ncbi:MAG: cytochrome c biogenesis protein CcsA, partial [Cyclobacteriaceae bacterium]|nr:cytochrome c biogenesis protein CcsA [Cyclobacteriaceae bacterium]
KQQNVRIYRKEGRLFLKYPGELKMVSMSNELEGTFNPHEEVPVTMLKLYVVGDISFVVKELIEGAIYKYRPAANNQQQGIPVTELRVNSTNITLPMGQQEVLNTGNTEIAVRVGNKPLELPFSLKLVKFQLERYPGSESPSSYASEVMVIDEANGQEFPYRIYMNNILDYGGFRFYQSSYDRDEQGTILSVNHDYWGTLITYFGYFLLFATLLVSFFTSKNRFRNVLRQIKNLRAERQQAIVGVVIVIVMSFFNYSEVLAQTNIADIDREHAERFGRMLIQDKDGRIVPINTIANKVLVKIYKKNTYYNLSADQVYLDLLSDHNKWQAKPVIYINDPALQSLLGLYDNYARFTDFFNEQGQYKIKDQVDQAYIKKPALRSKFDKELLNVNERVNVFYLTINGSLLNILPLPNDPGNKWATPGHYMHAAAKIPGLDSMIYSKYIYSLNEAKASGNYLEAETNLAKLISYQNEYGAAIIPPEKQTRMEILYNKLNIFKRLFPWYLSLGILLIGTFFMSIFKPGINLKIVEYAIFAVLFIGFIAHTYGLGLRWYVGGHAPWSNGYESMIYIAWAAMLSGFVFLRKAPVTMAVTSTLAGITLLTAHMSWLNPEITNLVPVLKSNWLTIHVATITASYGFFGLAAMMGFLNMCIMILRKRENYIRINFTVRELTLIIELALHAGLVLLVIGNFLGGIWANESWGRYWGWDPKETWTLVTVIFYSFVLHMRLIPKFKTLFTSNFFAVVGFGTVLMTYFGVNYYLSGLHSYAGGDPVPVPDFVYYVLVILGIVSVAALVNEAKLKDDNKPEVQNGNKEELMSRKTEPVF